MEALILAGGLGTRLAPVLPGIPKVLAPVAGQPFLKLLLQELRRNGIKRVVLSVGYKAELVREHLGDSFAGIELEYAVEVKPLGTGGAARASMALANTDPVFVLNGDTFVELEYAAMLARHQKAGADISLAVTRVGDSSRYGAIVISRDHRVIAFGEKSQAGPGYISAGVYLMSRDVFAPYRLPESFSLEQDFLSPYVQQLRPLAFETSGRFIDIGVPEDLARAQRELG